MCVNVSLVHNSQYGYNGYSRFTGWLDGVQSPLPGISRSVVLLYTCKSGEKHWKTDKKNM